MKKTASDIQIEYGLKEQNCKKHSVEQMLMVQKLRQNMLWNNAQIAQIALKNCQTKIQDKTEQ